MTNQYVFQAKGFVLRVYQRSFGWSWYALLKGVVCAGMSYDLVPATEDVAMKDGRNWLDLQMETRG